MKRIIFFLFVSVSFLSFGNNPCKNKLLLYVESGNMEGVKCAIENNADIEEKDDDGWTALIFAVSNGNIPLADYLISQGANIEAKTSNGSTPLIRASKRGELDMVKFLISKSADITARDERQSSACDVVRGNNSRSILEALNYCRK